MSKSTVSDLNLGLVTDPNCFFTLYSFVVYDRQPRDWTIGLEVFGAFTAADLGRAHGTSSSSAERNFAYHKLLTERSLSSPSDHL